MFDPVLRSSEMCIFCSEGVYLTPCRDLDKKYTSILLAIHIRYIACISIACHFIQVLSSILFVQTVICPCVLDFLTCGMKNNFLVSEYFTPSLDIF